MCRFCTIFVFDLVLMCSGVLTESLSNRHLSCLCVFQKVFCNQEIHVLFDFWLNSLVRLFPIFFRRNKWPQKKVHIQKPPRFLVKKFHVLFHVLFVAFICGYRILRYQNMYVIFSSKQLSQLSLPLSNNNSKPLIIPNLPEQPRFFIYINIHEDIYKKSTWKSRCTFCLP